jgi:hypothetical protein
MNITITDDFSVYSDTTLLGYLGETNARTIVVKQPVVENADTYRLRFEYVDGVVYDAPIVDNKLSVESSMLRYVGDVKLQWVATQGNRLVAKSNVLTMHIKDSLGDSEAIPTPEQAKDTLDTILRLQDTTAANVQVATDKAAEAKQSAELAADSEENAADSEDNARKYAESAQHSMDSASHLADSAKSSADSATGSAMSATSSANSAATSATNAQTAADKSATNATNAANSAASAKTAETNAQAAAEQADNAAVYSENAQQSAAAAESAKIAAEEKAAEITQNSTQIQQNKNDISELQDDRIYISNYGCAYKKNAIITNGSNNIPSNAYRDSIIESVVVPAAVTTVGNGAFMFCQKLKSIELPDAVKDLKWYNFQKCRLLKYIKLPAKIQTIGTNQSGDQGQVFAGAISLPSIELPNTLVFIGSNTFDSCKSLSNVVLGTDFNATGLKLTDCPLTVDCMVAMFENLKDLTDDTAKTLTLGSTNLAKLTDEQKQIATNKNWNLA